MKISSVRSDIVVVGGGIAGICSALSAAREGRTVSLLDKKSLLGGKLGFPCCHPIDDANFTPQVYKRDSGLINELWEKLFKFNQEGTYMGQTRVFKDWLRDEKRIKVYLNSELESLSLKNGSIKGVLAKDRNLRDMVAFSAKYFIDCTETGIVSELAGVSGEKGVDRNERVASENFIGSSHTEESCACFIRLRKGKTNSAFVCPDWVQIKWEDNKLSARLNLLKSMEKGFEGEHLLEWEGFSPEKNLDPLVIAFCAWDFLKNRSPIKSLMKDFELENVSEDILAPISFRADGFVKLNLQDLAEGKKWEDSIALGKVSIPQNFSRLFSSQNSHPLANPFEIPMRALITKECKNLFLVGSGSSSTELTSRSLGLPTCSAQMGTACGMIAAFCVEKSRLPKTVVKQGYIEEIRSKLYRKNHSYSLSGHEDFDNLSIEAKVTASSTLDDWILCCNKIERIVETRRCQIQFPVTSNRIENLILHLAAKEGQILSVKLYEGTGYHRSMPGVCLHSELIQIGSDVNKLECTPEVSVNEGCWHYLEIVGEQNFQVPLYKDGPVGYIFHDSRQKDHGNRTKFLTDYDPLLSRTPSPSPSPKIELYPKINAYLPSNVANHAYRPDKLPQLWISKSTDFKYPEFIELEWKESKIISCIEVSFDPSYEFIYPSHPTGMEDLNFQSLIKDYRIFSTDNDKKSKLIVEVRENQSAFRSHSFEPIEVKGIELEFGSTHGLNRAQVYQVRVYA